MQPCRRTRREGGFSFIEALVVVVLVGIVAAVAIPGIARAIRRAQLSAIAREIQSTLLAERMRAVRRNAVGSVVITPAAAGEPVHVVRALEPMPPIPPTPTPAPVQYVRDLRIQKNSIDFVTVPPGNTITFDGNGNLVVPPAPTPGIIVISGPAGVATPNQITIRTDPDGRVKVITPAVWY